MTGIARLAYRCLRAIAIGLYLVTVRPIVMTIEAIETMEAIETIGRIFPHPSDPKRKRDKHD